MTLIDDVRALGIGAPLRATYEVSKRTIGHSIVFGSLLQRGQAPSTIRLLPLPLHIGQVVRERTLAHAARICSGEVEVFGRSIDVGSTPDWSAVLHTDGRWPHESWWKIDIRSDERAGDIKWCWELARFRHVVILARAAWLQPEDEHVAACLRLHVTSFLDQNPPEVGVHWYSNLEISLRAYAWLQILSLAEPSLGRELSERIVDTMYRSGRHLVADLPYTVSTMRNNHLLGDAVGLCVLGYAFEDHRFGGRWSMIGDRLIARFLRTARRPMGTFIEDSVSYHRFVLELLTARATLGSSSPEATDALLDGAQFLCRLGVLEGTVPQYGDWDEGRALITAADPCSLDGSTRSALAWGGTGAPQAWLDEDDEVAWYCRPGQPAVPQPAVRTGADIGGGVVRAEVGGFTLWLKSPAGTSHNHADATAVAIRHDATWLVGDPGTGTYNGPIDQRNYFRGSRSHNVLRLDGHDQLGPHRAFRWKHRSRGGSLEPIELGPVIIVAGWHDAFTRLVPPSHVLRVVVVSEHGVRVADFVERQRPAELTLSFPPTVTLDSSRSLSIGEEHYNLTLPTAATMTVGGDEPFCGWWSSTYGQIEQAPILDMALEPTSVVAWSIGTANEPMAASGERLSLELGTISVTWRTEGVQLTLVDADGRSWAREATW